MQWLDATLMEPVWQQAAATPTNPSSLTLAMVGVGTLLLFGLRSRRKSQNQVPGKKVSQPATSSEKRRAA